MARLITIQLIESEEYVRGKGVEGDPARRVQQWFTTDGTLVLEKDPVKDGIDCTWNLYEFLQKQK